MSPMSPGKTSLQPSGDASEFCKLIYCPAQWIWNRSIRSCCYSLCGMCKTISKWKPLQLCRALYFSGWCQQGFQMWLQRIQTALEAFECWLLIKQVIAESEATSAFLYIQNQFSLLGLWQFSARTTCCIFLPGRSQTFTLCIRSVPSTGNIQGFVHLNQPNETTQKLGTAQIQTLCANTIVGMVSNGWWLGVTSKGSLW